MTIQQVPVGSIFHIDAGDSYPKLRIQGGYVCLRDEFVIPENKFYPTEDAVLSDKEAVEDAFLEKYGVQKHETASIIERLGRKSL